MYEDKVYEDKVLKCQDCGKDFDFSAKEQEFYAERDFSNPKRCKACRIKKKARYEKPSQYDGERSAQYNEKHPTQYDEEGKY